MIAIATKIAAVMREVGYVQKKGRNDFHKYNYVTEADVIEAVRGRLAERDVVMMPSFTVTERTQIENDRGKKGVLVHLKLRLQFIDAETGEYLIAESEGSGADSAPGDKAVYKAQTGAFKYALSKTFALATGDDPEREDEPRAAGPADTSAIRRKSAREEPSSAPPPAPAASAPAGPPEGADAASERRLTDKDIGKLMQHGRERGHKDADMDRWLKQTFRLKLTRKELTVAQGKEAWARFSSDEPLTGAA